MAEIKLIPGDPQWGTAGQWTGIGANGGINPDTTKDFHKTFQELLLDRRILSDQLLTFLQIARENGYRQVFQTYSFPERQGSLVAVFVGFKGGTANPEDFRMTYGEFRDAENEQTMDGYSVEVTTGYFGAFSKFHIHNIATMPYDIVNIQLKMMMKQAITVLDNVAGQALFNGGNTFIAGEYVPEAADGLTVNLLNTLTKNANDYGPLSWDILEVVQDHFRSRLIKLPKITPKAGSTTGETEITYVDVNMPVKPQSDGNYTILVSYDGARQLMTDPKFHKAYVQNGYQQDAAFNYSMIQNGSVWRGYRFLIIENPITVDFEKAQVAYPNNPLFTGSDTIVPILNFYGTGICQFATVIGGETTQEICIETNFLTGGINWISVLPQHQLGDFYGYTRLEGWNGFYGATVVDTSRVTNIIYNPKGFPKVIKSGTINKLPDAYQRPQELNKQNP